MMRRISHRGAVVALGAAVLALLCGCNGSTSSGALFLDFVQTVLLGVTAAGAVVIIREV